jgi:hypothetical protein
MLKNVKSTKKASHKEANAMRCEAKRERANEDPEDDPTIYSLLHTLRTDPETAQSSQTVLAVGTVQRE